MGFSHGSWRQQSDEGPAETLEGGGRDRSPGTRLGQWHYAPPTIPQVEEALAVLQAHQATEWTKANVTETRWVAESEKW